MRIFIFTFALSFLFLFDVLSASQEPVMQAVALQDLTEYSHRNVNFNTWHDHITGMEFVWLPKGCFDMGSPNNEKGRYSDEGPVHTVCVDGFWMGKYEVTNAQYREFKSDHDSNSAQDSNSVKGHSLNDDNQAVVYVSWEDARAYATWLKKRNGAKYEFRLPTEAEWEYAARADTKAARFWGDSPDDACGYANVNDQISKKEFNWSWGSHDCSDGYAVTAPVGSFKPNAFGLFDMLGNIWEWCEDIYANKSYAQHVRDNPLYTGSGSDYVMRGGSWDNDSRGVRSALRSRQSPDFKFNNVGFRLLRTK